MYLSVYAQICKILSLVSLTESNVNYLSWFVFEFSSSRFYLLDQDPIFSRSQQRSMLHRFAGLWMQEGLRSRLSKRSWPRKASHWSVIYSQNSVIYYDRGQENKTIVAIIFKKQMHAQTRQRKPRWRVPSVKSSYLPKEDRSETSSINLNEKRPFLISV